MNVKPLDATALLRDDEISLSEIWGALKSRWIAILVVTVLCGALATAVAFLTTPTYRAEVVLTLVEDSAKGSDLGGLASQFGGLASLAGVSLGGSSSRAEALGTLGSKQLLHAYIVRQNLLPVLFHKKWDASRKDWDGNVSKVPTLWDATQYFIKNVRSIGEDKKSGLVTLSIEWENATQSAQWANELVSLANESLRQRAIVKSESNLAYLNAQLEKTSVIELRQAIYRLIEAEVKNVMVAQGNKDYAFKIIDPAVVPEKKSKPKRGLIIAVGLFLGLFMGSLYALASSNKNA